MGKGGIKALARVGESIKKILLGMKLKFMEPNELRIRAKLKTLHEKENDLNKEIGKIDGQIKLLNKKKGKIAKQVSHNMRYRNRLINQL